MGARAIADHEPFLTVTTPWKTLPLGGPKGHHKLWKLQRVRSAAHAQSLAEECFQTLGPLSAAWRSAFKNSPAMIHALYDHRALTDATWTALSPYGVELEERGGPEAGTVLHRAAADSNVPLVEALLAAGADPCAFDRLHRQPLDGARCPTSSLGGAALSDRTATVRHLLVEAGAPVCTPALLQALREHTNASRQWVVDVMDVRWRAAWCTPCPDTGAVALDVLVQQRGTFWDPGHRAAIDRWGPELERAALDAIVPARTPARSQAKTRL